MLASLCLQINQHEHGTRVQSRHGTAGTLSFMGVVPAALQWDMVKHKEQSPEHTHVLIDLGFVVSSK